jgi:biotin carboxyl carrier protein
MTILELAARLLDKAGRRDRGGDMAKVVVKSEIAGKVWKIESKVGDRIDEEGQIMILESMKMEIPVLAPRGGTLAEIHVAEGDAVAEGQPVATLDA